MNVDLLFQNLVEIHGVDAAALEAELVGAVRTPDYPGKGATRRVLANLPDGFPRFRGTAGPGHLIVERMRLPKDAVYSSTASSATLSIARPPQLPITVLNALRDIPLTHIVEGDGFSDRMRIISAHSAKRRENGIEIETLDMALDMPLAKLSGTGRPAPGRSVPRPSDILSAHLSRFDDDVASRILGAINPTDPRSWRDTLDYDGAIFGMRIEERRGTEHLVLRFPYDKAIVGRVGHGGFGAWYDQDTWSWCMSGHDFDIAAMMTALGDLSPVFVLDQEGAVYGGTRR